MNPFMQQIINHKINTLTVNELLALALQHRIDITDEQAMKVIHIIHSETIDVANQKQVERMIYRLQTEIDDHVATVITQLLKQYEHLL